MEGAASGWETFERVLRPLVVRQGGALAIGLIVTFLVAGNLRRLRSRENLVVLGLLAVAPLLLDVIDYWEWHLRSLPAKALFLGIYVYTACVTVASVRLTRRGTEHAWRPNLPRAALLLLVVLGVGLDLLAAFGRAPDDCGIYTNLGARRWVETGTMPYGDPLLKGPTSPGRGAAATYGPLLYAAHVPAQAVAGTVENPPDLDPMDKRYVRPPHFASQLVAAGFQVLALGALFLLGRRLGGPDAGLALTALYALCPYVLGLGGERLVIGGMPFISHVVPTAVVLLALAAVDRPWLSGALLAAGAGVLFVPAFFFPAWLGWHFWRSRRAALSFGAGFAVAGALVALLVWASTAGPDPIRAFLESTVEHQEGAEYGTSRFGFWGQFPGLAGFFQQPLFGSHGVFKPTFLLFGGFACSAFVLARGRSLAQLAALTAALAAAVQLWKTHAAGTYVEWYYPFLLLALFCNPREGATPAPDRGAAAPAG